MRAMFILGFLSWRWRMLMYRICRCPWRRIAPIWDGCIVCAAIPMLDVNIRRIGFVAGADAELRLIGFVAGADAELWSIGFGAAADSELPPCCRCRCRLSLIANCAVLGLAVALIANCAVLDLPICAVLDAVVSVSIGDLRGIGFGGVAGSELPLCCRCRWR